MNNIITSEHFNEISNLLDGTDFNGVDYEKGISLFNYGFIYDSISEEIIITHPIKIWNIKDVNIKFAIIGLTSDRIDEVFNMDSFRILSENNLTLSAWNDLCDSYKINIIQNTNAGLELYTNELDLTSEDLIEYLKIKSV